MSTVLGVGVIGFNLHRVFRLLSDGLASMIGGSLLFGTQARELDEFNTRGTDRMGPVNRALGLGDTSSDFIKKI